MNLRIFSLLFVAWVSPLLYVMADPETSKADPEDFYEQARNHIYGWGVPRDFSRAYELMQKSADAGFPDAVGMMGYFYATGAGVSKNEAVAAEWFQKGAELGSSKSQLNYGNALLFGRGLEKNETEGIRWITMAADAGLPRAQTQIGIMYFFGENGVNEDLTTAAKYLLPAAEAGNPQAMSAMAFLYTHGKGGIKSDIQKGLELYRKAAELGERKAQANLGTILLNKARTKEERHEALTWLYVAEMNSEPIGRNVLAELRAGPIDPKEFEEAQKAARDLHSKTQRNSLKLRIPSRDS